MKARWFSLVVVMATVAAGPVAAVAEVTIETVPLGNPGNGGEWSGESYGGYGLDRISGAVDYEYRIGKYEVTAGQYTEFLNAVAGVDTHDVYNISMWLSDWGCKTERFDGNGTAGNPYQYRVAGDWADRPVNYVSWGDAVRFTNWLHNGQPTGLQDLTTTEDGAYYLNGATSDAALMAVSREADWKWAVPTEDEWYKAAYHKNDGDSNNYFDYPTSSDSVPGTDVTEGTNPGNNANYRTDSGYLIGSPYYRTEVGEFELSDSPYGTFDQGGNVWEWNETLILIGPSRGLRGGSFNVVDGLRASDRGNNIPTNDDVNVGFRVAAVPEPTTLVLLALGGLALIRRRRANGRTAHNRKEMER